MDVDGIFMMLRLVLHITGDRVDWENLFSQLGHIGSKRGGEMDADEDFKMMWRLALHIIIGEIIYMVAIPIVAPSNKSYLV